MTDISEIWKFDLRGGNSKNPRDGACLLDAVSWFEYGKLGDHPPCVCPVIAAFARGVNDAMSDAGRQRLKVFIPRLVGTVDPENEVERGVYLAWQAIRVFAPLALDHEGLNKQAARLRNFSGSLEEAARAAWAAAEAARAAWAAEAAARATELARGAAPMLKTRAAWAALAAAAAARAAATALEGAWMPSAKVWEKAWAESANVLPLAKAAREAREAGEAALAAAARAVEDAMIEALDGVLAIGRQAEHIPPARLAEAARLFELARSK